MLKEVICSSSVTHCYCCKSPYVYSLDLLLLMLCFLPMASAEGISNAYQKNGKGNLLKEMRWCIRIVLYIVGSSTSMCIYYCCYCCCCSRVHPSVGTSNAYQQNVKGTLL